MYKMGKCAEPDCIEIGNVRKRINGRPIMILEGIKAEPMILQLLKNAWNPGVQWTNSKYQGNMVAPHIGRRRRRRGPPGQWSRVTLDPGCLGTHYL
jgi:hypothetical protein